MANETVARRYAQAIFQLAHEAGSVEQTGRELRVVRDAILSGDATRRFFYAPVVDRAEKQRVLNAVFGSRVSALVLHSLILLVRKRRERLLLEIVGQYQLLEEQARGAQPLHVWSARPLPAGELERLVARLSALYGATFDVTAAVDPDLIGGMRIMMSDKRIDGTVAGRLDELARSLLKT